jgi:pimeloyl-ACP methyl ester carboxylesterase
MSSFHPAARQAYVRHGFKPAPDGTVELKCLPEHEARTYETGGSHGTWEDLARVSVPTWVIAGAQAPFQPSSIAPRIAELVPNATYVQYDDMGHFGPLENPHALAALVQATLASRQ